MSISSTGAEKENHGIVDFQRCNDPHPGETGKKQ
jgi:hypothetical protein